ncbi:MAG: FAD-binding domain-containing protein [Tabrizicola sp.]
MNVLVWLKRDLRVHDHPALVLAAGLGPVLPVYVVEPELWAGPDASARQWECVAEALADLREDLAALGAPLVVRVGDAVTVLAGLCKRHGITRIVSHEETGNLWTYARDRRVAAWARGAGVEWVEVPQCGVVRRLPSRDMWAASRDGFMAQGVLPVPTLHAVEGVEPGLIPTARALKLAPDPCPHRQLGGRTRGLELVESFLSRRGEPYRVAMSSPLTAERACSRLSPHFALGTLSIREVVQATAARQAERPRGNWGGSLSSFQSRLAWRDHFMQKLEDQPSIEVRDLHPVAVTRPREMDATRLEAWAAGETGLPFLDACIRYVRATGWLNFRMRAMVTSVASYHLWLDWRATGQHLARMFTDYEPGIHWPQVQMQSGVTGINIPRIYNPIKQSQDQDPNGEFIRRWIPELAAIPDALIHTPWLLPVAQQQRLGVQIGRDYPAPVFDHEQAARAAKARLTDWRRRPGMLDQSRAVLAKHGSRKRRIEKSVPKSNPQLDLFGGP